MMYATIIMIIKVTSFPDKYNCMITMTTNERRRTSLRTFDAFHIKLIVLMKGKGIVILRMLCIKG